MTPITFAELRQEDTVRVTGVVTSEGGLRVTNLDGIVATKSGDGTFKLWPKDHDDPQLPADCNGKLWFVGSETEIVLLARDEE